MEFSVGLSSVWGLLLLLLTFGADTSWAASWSYDGKTGPYYWHKLFPEECSGRGQSPIDIKVEETMFNPNLRDFAIWTDPPKPGSTMTVLNNGHTVQVVPNGDFFVTNAGLPNIYKTAQFHFHWGDAKHQGSEHLIDSVAYPLELHIVNYNWEVYKDIGEAVQEKQGLAVLGVMFELSDEDNEELEPVIAAMEQVEDPEDRVQVEIESVSLRRLLPDNIKDYFRYNGSLTTPGCFETVIWTVFATPQKISVRQMEKFRDQLQMRHKHGGHKKRSTRDPLPVDRLERRRERRALQVLDELALTPLEKDRFRRELTSKKEHAETMAAKIDETGARDSHLRTLEAVHQSGHHEGGGEDEHVSEVEMEFLQEKLVNNFRPVQPLNDRLVYRSFTLRGREAPHHPHHNHHQHQHPKKTHHHHYPPTPNPNLPDTETIRERLKNYQSLDSAAPSNVMSLLLLVLSSCLAALFW